MSLIDEAVKPKAKAPAPAPKKPATTPALLEDLKARMDGANKRLVEMRAKHKAQLAEQVAERRTLEREFTEAHRAYHAAK